jgi:hypothetical protein
METSPSRPVSSARDPWAHGHTSCIVESQGHTLALLGDLLLMAALPFFATTYRHNHDAELTKLREGERCGY